MEILGLSPVVLTIIIAIVGVSYRVLTGMIGKSWSEFNPLSVLTTFMLAFVTSVGLVAPVLDALPSDLSQTMQLAVVAGQVATIMGVDAVIVKGQEIAQAIQAKKSAKTRSKKH